jgi:GntR family phosphonate transport system transcriptional regulator
VGRLHRRLLAAWEAAAERDTAERLRLERGALVLTMQIAAYADERPISVVLRHCDGRRFRGLAEVFEREGSLTRALRGHGVADYRRAATEITARMPTAEEARLLIQPRVSPVLAYSAIDVEVGSGRAVSFQTGCFAAERVLIVVGDDRP